MGNPAQTGLDSPQDDWPGSLEISSYEVGVDDCGAVGTPVINAPRRVVITFAPFSRCRTVGNHRVDTAAGDAPQ